MSEFTGKNVIVTGAAGALGSAVAQAFHDHGAQVTGLDIAESSADYAMVKGDLINFENARTLFESFERVDVLANIAGGFTMGDGVAETSDDTWDFMMDLNARTVLNSVRAVVPKMKEAGKGKIINIGARSGIRGVGNMAAYCASKSVVIRLTESLADELKKFNINVNCILPSIIDTPQNRSDMPKADFSRWVTPVAMAKVVLFLASSAADPIHGAAVPVEGLA